MTSSRAIVVGSLVVHGVAFAALGAVRTPELRPDTAIEVTETAPPEKTPEPPPPEPAPEPAAPKEAAPRPQQAKAAPPPSAPAAAEPVASPGGDVPDLGLELAGATGGTGLSVPVPRAAPATSAAPVVRKTLAAAPAPAKTADACDEPAAKPKLVELPQPAYTEAARAAGVEGKIRIELTVDETGNVVGAKPLTSLGHGLDEAALAAARAARFSPAVRCGRPSRSTFTIAIRFAA